MLKKRSFVFAIFGAAIALIGGPLAAPASADVAIVIDVAAGLTAPATADGVFTAVGTISNTGTLGDQSGSTLTISATGGSVTSAPGCTLSAGTATCTATSLPTGTSASFSVTVTPATGSNTVTTQAVATSSLLEVNVLDLTNNTATATTGVAYGVDASLLNNKPLVKTGLSTLLTVTAVNTKAAQTVNTVLASPGGTVGTSPALPAGCSITNGGANLNCSFALAAGQSKTFDVAVKAPANGSAMTSTLTVTGVNGGSKTVSTVTNQSPYAQAFVPEGTNITYSGSNQFSTFWVPVGSTSGGGTFVELREVSTTGLTCDGQPCIQQAADAIFPGDGPYSGQDPNHPFVWEIKYNERQVCNSAKTCLIEVYWVPTGGTATQRIALCPTYSPSASIFSARLNNINEPCLQKVDKTVKGYATYTIAVLRDITIPIISSING